MKRFEDIIKEEILNYRKKSKPNLQKLKDQLVKAKFENNTKLVKMIELMIKRISSK